MSGDRKSLPAETGSAEIDAFLEQIRRAPPAP